jgi:acyl-CoA synthetase (AMP-forming)/AMP-acid ligase II
MISVIDAATLGHVLESHAVHQPDLIAFTCLSSGEDELESISFAGLDRRVRAVAGLLQEAGVGVGDRALLLYPPGIDFVAAFLACLYAGVIAVPTSPPNPARLDRTLPVVASVLSNAGANIVMTTAAFHAYGAALGSAVAAFADIRWLVTDAFASEDDRRSAAEQWRRPEKLGRGDVAFLQYTSGSTGQPKGVVLTHGNLLANQEMQVRAYRLSRATTIVNWLPLYHDMGLACALGAISVGCRVIMMSPIDFIARPMRWLRAISKYRGTFSAGPNFAFELCARKAQPSDHVGLDLRSWQTALAGAEPVQATTLDRFVRVFGPAGFAKNAFAPSFGLAEACVLVSTTPAYEIPETVVVDAGELEALRVVESPRGEGARELVTSGHPVDSDVVIVREDGRTAAPNEVGEIWVRGRNVGEGYWQNEEASRQTFGGRTDTGDGPYLRTGDLGFLHRGQLYIAGRLKDLIIVRGRNYYPDDIEQTVLASYPSLRPGGAAAFPLHAHGEERLVVVVEVEPRYVPKGPWSPPDFGARARPSPRRPPPEFDQVQPDGVLPFAPESIIGAIRTNVTLVHELATYAVVLVAPRSIPKTSSGKVQRRACRQLYLEKQLEVVAEEHLAPEGGAST